MNFLKRKIKQVVLLEKSKNEYLLDANVNTKMNCELLFSISMINIIIQISKFKTQENRVKIGFYISFSHSGR